MFILRFAFENHASFRDEADLTMVKPTLRASSPRDGTWLDYTTRVAAIYGSNASGKSTVLDALRFMRAAVSDSSTHWAKRNRLDTVPFALDEASKNLPSSYILDFVLDDIRYEYGFSLRPRRVEAEWLYSYPVGRRRIAFERVAGASSLSAGRELGGGGPTLDRTTGERELVLSRGALMKHPLLEKIHNAIVDQIGIARFGESDRQSRLDSVVKDVADGALSLDDLRTMLRVADVGIVGAEVQEKTADPLTSMIYREVFLAVSRGVKEVAAAKIAEAANAENGENEDDTDERLQKYLAELARSLMFLHRGDGDEPYMLPTASQSTGTLTWLSLASPAIKTVREGGVLAVDELDASMHPQLAQVMIQMFRDETINQTGAQLIFTTHDTYFMSPTADQRLSPDEVWFVEKDQRGISDLYRLADFPTRADENFSRRYLNGRYGAIPSVAPSFLARLVQGQGGETDSRMA